MEVKIRNYSEHAYKISNDLLYLKCFNRIQLFITLRELTLYRPQYWECTLVSEKLKGFAPLKYAILGFGKGLNFKYEFSRGVIYF